jgi:hypothetical protein
MATNPTPAAAAAPTAAPGIFISYRHAPPTTAIARELYTALVPPAEAWGAELFMDEQDIEPAELFDEVIVGALDRCTDFVVLLSNGYWSSAYCRKELLRVLGRFERERSVRLHFVKVDELDPAHFSFAKDRAAGRIVSDDAQVQRIGDVQFLGPFDAYGRLVRLSWEQPAGLSDQLGQLVQRLGRVVGKPPGAGAGRGA